MVLRLTGNSGNDGIFGSDPWSGPTLGPDEVDDASIPWRTPVAGVTRTSCGSLEADGGPRGRLPQHLCAATRAAPSLCPRGFCELTAPLGWTTSSWWGAGPDRLCRQALRLVLLKPLRGTQARTWAGRWESVPGTVLPITVFDFRAGRCLSHQVHWLRSVPVDVLPRATYDPLPEDGEQDR